MSSQLPKNNWSRVLLPPELSDLLYAMAKKHGYEREQVHLYLYQALKLSYPVEVEQLADFYELRWMDGEINAD